MHRQADTFGGIRCRHFTTRVHTAASQPSTDGEIAANSANVAQWELAKPVKPATMQLSMKLL